jgi:hypothetical protein
MTLGAAAWLVPATSHAQVHLSGSTSPSSGVAGVNNVNVTGSGFPSGLITPANVTATFALGCGGTVVATSPGNSVITILGSSKRVNVTLPGSLASGVYFVQISDLAGGDADFTSMNCAQVQVTHTSATLSACVPASSLGVVAPVTGPNPVNAIVPNGAWSRGNLGIEVVQLETGGGPAVPPVSISTTDAINSCAGNPATGESVCVANNNHVYHLSSSNVPTILTSGANGSTGFSGGSCTNCGVAINALTNQAVVQVADAASPSGSGFQALDLATNTFHPIFDMHAQISENVTIDPNRGFVLSPNESSIYGLAQFNTSGAFTAEFDHSISAGGEPDSAAEDCTTGIALTVGEFSNTVYLADLTQATFTSGTPGSWTAPEASPSIIGSYSAGLSGVTVAPGNGHLATVTGEFGGSSFSVLLLPSTSGPGTTPHIVDYAYASCINNFSAGFDPHTLTAYTSPNDGKAYTVFANWDTGLPATVAVVDMAAVLALPRGSDGHSIIPPAGHACLQDGDGIVRFVSTH